MSRPAHDRPPWVLAPVAVLSDRLGTSLRLVFLVGLLVVPAVFATWAFAGAMGSQVDFTGKERQGAEVLGPALTALATTAGGTMPDLAGLDAAAAGSGLDLTRPLAAVHSAAGGPGAATPAGRSALAGALAGLVTAIGNDSNLILDPDLDSFYVMDIQVVELPRLLIAGAAAAAVAPAPRQSPGSTEQEVAGLAVQAGTLVSAAESIRAGVATARAQTALPDLAGRLADAGRAADAAAALSRSITDDLARHRPADATPLASAAAKAVEPTNAVLIALLDARAERLAGSRDRTIGLSLAGLLLAIWFAAAVLWRSRHDVGQLVAALPSLADPAQAERPLPAGRDELGTIGRALAGARASLLAAGALLEHTQAEREDQLRIGFQRAKHSEQRVRQHAQELITETVTIVLGELDQVRTQVAQMRTSTVKIDAQVDDAQATAHGVTVQARAADLVVEALGGSLRRVAEMTELISGVADQTRLLALNAGIEAARAGQAGRGFTVVAGQVKELAQTTARSTEQITRTIDALQRHAVEVAGTISRMTSGIAGVDEMAGRLRAVAADQQQVMGLLDGSVTDAVGRVSSLTGLLDSLERRRHERIPATGPAVIVAAGTPRSVQLLDLSVSGCRLELPLGLVLQVGEVIEVELRIGGTPLRARAGVLRLEHDGGQPAVAVAFDQLPPEVENQLHRHVTELRKAPAVRDP